MRTPARNKPLRGVLIDSDAIVLLLGAGEGRPELPLPWVAPAVYC